jgi:hypothetical protein
MRKTLQRVIMTKRVFKVLEISNIDVCSLSWTSYSILVGCEKHSQTLYEKNLESLFCFYNQNLSFIVSTFEIAMVDHKNFLKIDKQSFSKTSLHSWKDNKLQKKTSSSFHLLCFYETLNYQLFWKENNMIFIMEFFWILSFK